MLAQANVKALPLAAESVDLIFTDPPYLKAFLPAYEWLAAEAARVLRPGGFCLAMAGGYYLDKVMTSLGQHLDFFWKFELFMSDVSTVIWPRRVIARSKPILAYVKGKGMPQCNVLGAMVGGGNDKRFHHWGQDVESARYYIDVFSKKGDLVLDPFIGGGTTLIASELIGRRCIGFDVDMESVKITAERRKNTEIPTALPLFGKLAQVENG